MSDTDNSVEASLGTVTLLAASSSATQPSNDHTRGSSLAQLRSASEKGRSELKRLNEQLFSYVDKAKDLERENSRLLQEVELEKGKHIPKIDKNEYNARLADARVQLENVSNECVFHEVDVEVTEDTKDELAKRIRFYQNEADTQKSKILQLQSLLADLEYEKQFIVKSSVQTEHELSAEHDRILQSEDELARLRQKLGELRFKNKKLEFEMQTLQDEKQFAQAVHEEELSSLKNFGNSVPSNVDLTTFYRQELKNAVRDIRVDFHRLKDQQLAELKEQKEAELENHKDLAQKQRAARQAQAGDLHDVSLDQLPEELGQNKHELAQLNAKLNEKMSKLNGLENELKFLREDNARLLEKKNAEIDNLRDTNDVYLSEVDYWDRATRAKLDSELQAYKSLLNYQLNALDPEGKHRKVSVDKNTTASKPKPQEPQQVKPDQSRGSVQVLPGSVIISNLVQSEVIETVLPAIPPPEPQAQSKPNDGNQSVTSSIIISSVKRDDTNEAAPVRPPTEPQQGGVGSVIISSVKNEGPGSVLVSSVTRQVTPSPPPPPPPVTPQQPSANDNVLVSTIVRNNSPPPQPSQPPAPGNMLVSSVVRKESMSPPPVPTQPPPMSKDSDNVSKTGSVLISSVTNRQTESQQSSKQPSNQVSSGSLSQEFLEVRRPSTVVIADGNRRQSEQVVMQSSSRVQQQPVVQARRSSERPQSQSSSLRRLFDMFDKDHSGYVAGYEFANVFQLLEINMSQRDLDRFIIESDLDGNRRVDFVEFSRLLSPYLKEKLTREELLNAFSYFDRDNSGFITVSELSQILAKFGSVYSERQISNMIYRVDRDSDGRLNFEEFYNLMTNSSAANSPPSEQVKPKARKSVTVVSSGSFEVTEAPRQASAPTSSAANRTRDSLRRVFDAFDRDKSGYINRQELQNILKALDLNLNDQRCQDIINEADSNSSDDIDFNEFCRIMEPAMSGTLTREQLWNAFTHFDRDGSGQISVQELSRVLSALGQNYSDAQIARMVAKVDRNSDGQLSFDEFVALMSSPL